MALSVTGRQDLAAGLATDFPQVQWDGDLVDRLRQALELIPERDGPLSRYIRHAEGKLIESRTAHAVFESHINVTSIPAKGERSLILLGFEPDDFRVPYPRKYARHFTLKLKISQARARRSSLMSWLALQTTAATEILQGLPGIEWYVEREVYPVRNVRTYSCRGMDESPLSETMTLRTDVRSEGVCPSEFGKRADIHVKLCVHCM